MLAYPGNHAVRIGIRELTGYELWPRGRPCEVDIADVRDRIPPSCGAGSDETSELALDSRHLRGDKGDVVGNGDCGARHDPVDQPGGRRRDSIDTRSAEAVLARKGHDARGNWRHGTVSHVDPADAAREADARGSLLAPGDAVVTAVARFGDVEAPVEAKG